MASSPETGRINRGIQSVRPADPVSVPNAIESAGEGWDLPYKLTSQTIQSLRFGPDNRHTDL